MRPWAFVLLILCGFGGLNRAVADDDSVGRVRQTGVINVGYRAGAVPFSYTLPGEAVPTGFAIDLCQKVIDELRASLKLPSLRVRYLAVDPATRFSALKAGTIDMECANTTMTADRRAQGFAFSLPYFMTGSRLLVREGVQAEDLKDLAGKTVVVIEGTTTANTLRVRDGALSLGLKLLYAKKRQEAFAMLSAAGADAMAEDDTVLHGLRATSTQPQAYKVTGKYLSVEPFGIMLAEGQPALKAAADRVLRKLMRSGELALLHQRWFQAPIAPDGIVVGVPMSALMRDFIRYPIDNLNAYP